MRLSSTQVFDTVEERLELAGYGRIDHGYTCARALCATPLLPPSNANQDDTLQDPTI